MAKKKKIGEILLDNNLVTEEILNQALEYQKKFGIPITQYLISNGFVEEEGLAKCISAQFECPYLPLWAYSISSDIIELIPSETAQKYWVVPVDRIENLITVVMADPFDDEAISEIKKLTNCRVQAFVGIFSDIVKTIEKYYKIQIEDPSLKKETRIKPLFVYANTYVGMERRRAMRIPLELEIHFPWQNSYVGSRTKDVSRYGLLFKSENALPLYSYVIIQIALPKKYCEYPIAAVVQVVRVVQAEHKSFNIGANIVKIPKDDIDKIMHYASSLVK